MNLSRMFVEKPHIAWVALVATLIWGAVAWQRMPQRKDPEIVIKTAVISTQWPGGAAEDVEALLTRPIERLAGQVAKVDRVTSTSRTGLSTVFVTLEDTAKRQDLEPAWADLQSRLELVAKTLPQGAQPPQLNTHFGDTATVVWSVASPPVDDVELELRSQAIGKALSAHRAGKPEPNLRLATVFVPAPGVSRLVVAQSAERYLALGREMGALSDGAVVWGTSFVAVDFRPTSRELRDRWQKAFRSDIVGAEPPHPDVWGPIEISDLSQIKAPLARAAADKYSWRQLDDLSADLRDRIARLPEVARVDRHGLVPERIYLLYSQERLASFGLQPRQIGEALRARNVTVPAGSVTTGQQVLLLDPGAAYVSVEEILDTPVAQAKDGKSIHVRDVAEVHRS